MNFQAYVQLADGDIYELDIKPLTTRAMARDAVLAARCAVLEVGESTLMDCIVKTTRKPYRASLGQTSIWYERVGK